MITIKTDKEIEKMRQGGKLLAKILQQVAKKAEPGVKTEKLNDYATELILQAGALPAFLGYEGFPASICTSVNEQVVHGVPSERKLKKGDVLGLDLGILYPPENCRTCPSAGTCATEPGMFTDAATTVIVGRGNQQTEKLVAVAKKALDLAIAQVKPGARLGDIGWAVQKYVEEQDFSIIRDLVGHGVGHQLHEEPQIPNFGQQGTGELLKEGMTLAIEPMVAVGGFEVKKGKDGFGYETKDKSPVAHFEHTVVVSKKGCEILTKT